MCWAGAVVAAPGSKDAPIAHCEEGAALCCSCEVSWGFTCAARHRGNEEVVHNAEGRLGDD